MSKKYNGIPAGYDKDHFLAEERTIDAVVRNLEIGGKAVRQLSDAFKQDHEKIPWHQLAGLRNRIVHDDFGLDLDIIRNAVANDLPALKLQLESLRISFVLLGFSTAVSTVLRAAAQHLLEYIDVLKCKISLYSLCFHGGSPMKQIVICIIISVFFLSGCAKSPENTPVNTPFQNASSAEFINIHSKEVGWNQIDATIREVERSDRTSLVKLIGFNKNSGMEGRFFMSFVLRLAQFRGFRYVIYSIPSGEGANLESVIIFSQSENELLESTFEEQFSKYEFYEPRIVMDTKSEIWKLLSDNCGF